MIAENFHSCFIFSIEIYRGVFVQKFNRFFSVTSCGANRKYIYGGSRVGFAFRVYKTKKIGELPRNMFASAKRYVWVFNFTYGSYSNCPISVYNSAPHISVLSITQQFNCRAFAGYDAICSQVSENFFRSYFDRIPAGSLPCLTRVRVFLAYFMRAFKEFFEFLHVFFVFGCQSQRNASAFFVDAAIRKQHTDPVKSFRCWFGESVVIEIATPSGVPSASSRQTTLFDDSQNMFVSDIKVCSYPARMPAINIPVNNFIFLRSSQFPISNWDISSTREHYNILVTDTKFFRQRIGRPPSGVQTSNFLSLFRCKFVFPVVFGNRFSYSFESHGKPHLSVGQGSLVAANDNDPVFMHVLSGNCKRVA